VDNPVDPTLLDDRGAARLRGELAIDAAGIGTFDWELTTGDLDWDDRLITLFGYDSATFDRSITGFNDRVHPDDLDRVTSALQAAIDSCGEFAALYRVVLPGGEHRWVSARGRTLAEPAGTATRLLGAAYDVTPQQEADLSVARVLEAMPAAFFSLSRDWRFTYLNAHAEQLLAGVRSDLLGEEIWEAFPDAVGSPFEDRYRHAMVSAQDVTFEADYPPPLDSWYEALTWPTPEGLSVYFFDVTARRRAPQRAAASAVRSRTACTTSCGNAAASPDTAPTAPPASARSMSASAPTNTSSPSMR